MRWISQIFCSAALTAAIGTLSTAPVMAQKSADTMRIAINNPFPVLSQYQYSVDEATQFVEAVYEPLLSYDERQRKWIPRLATAWTRPNPTVLEFELRQGVKFHNGNDFNADDVVATIEYLIDPNVKLRYKHYYSWIDKVEKLGPHKVRLIAKKPDATDLGQLAFHTDLQDAEAMKSLSNQEDYGRLTPFGTGRYKVTQLDRNAGLIVDRYEGFVGNKDYTRASVKRIHGIFLPDRQTQIAQLMTGGVDVVFNLEPDQTKELAQRKGIKVSHTPGGNILYIGFNASGSSGNKALTNPKVRKALMMAIDRDSLIKNIVPGGELAIKLDVPCFESAVGCQYSSKPPAYDLDGAKKLLTEAGYPNGFDMELSVYAPIQDVAVAISGQLRRLGVNVAVEPLVFGTYRKKSDAGEFQAFSIYYPLGNFPDLSQLRTWFSGNTTFRYYENDPTIAKAMVDAGVELDPIKRAGLYEIVLNRVNEMHYLLPISTLPVAYAHGTNVRVSEHLLSTTSLDATGLMFVD